MTRRTVLLSVLGGLAVLAYGGARWALQTLDSNFRRPGGAASPEYAATYGTLLGVYRAVGPTCGESYNRFDGEPVPAYAERLFTFRLDPLLRRRVVPSDKIAVRVGTTVSPEEYRDLSLELDDGTRADCCYAKAETVPQTLWLVRGETGERLCEYTFAGMPEAVRVERVVRALKDKLL